MAIFDDLVISI